jgi:hypothetical protein
MVVFPCQRCENRKIGCHSTCQKYLEAKGKHEAYKLAEKQKGESDIADFKSKTIYAGKRKAGRW